MSLKNRNETKLLMENWRKVLKEGLYDSDPELLEEGVALNSALTLSTLIVSLLPSLSNAELVNNGIPVDTQTISKAADFEAQQLVKDLMSGETVVNFGDKLSFVEMLQNHMTVNAEKLEITDDMVNKIKAAAASMDEMVLSMRSKLRKLVDKKNKLVKDGSEGGYVGDIEHNVDLQEVVSEIDFLAQEFKSAVNSAENLKIFRGESDGTESVQVYTKNEGGQLIQIASKTKGIQSQLNSAIDRESRRTGADAPASDLSKLMGQGMGMQ